MDEVMNSWTVSKKMSGQDLVQRCSHVCGAHWSDRSTRTFCLISISSYKSYTFVHLCCSELHGFLR